MATNRNRNERPLTPDELLALPAADYERLSSNPDGTIDSCGNQRAHNVGWAHELWAGRPLLSFEDDDIGADDPTIDRPGFNDLLDFIRARKVGAVIATMQSRLTRNGEEFAILRRACLAVGIECWYLSTTRSVTEIGLAKALEPRITVAFDEHHNEVIKMNVRRTQRLYAERGEPPGGRIFGYVRGSKPRKGPAPLVPDETVRGVAQSMAEQLLRGVPEMTIGKRLNEQGVPTADGKRWRPGSVKRVVTNPTLAGYRVHQGEIIGDGQWEPIIDRRTWKAVQRKLSGPGQVVKSNGRIATRGMPRGRPARYLVSVFARCARPSCLDAGAYMVGTARQRTEPQYTCHSSTGGCDHNSAWVDFVDAEVERQLMEYLDSDEYLVAIAEGDPYAPIRKSLTDELARIDVERDLDTDDKEAGRISRKTYIRLEAKHDAREAEIEAELTALPLEMTSVQPDAIKVAWAEADLGERRTILSLLVDRVLIEPGPKLRGKRGADGFVERRFDASRVSVVRRTLP